MKKTRTRGFRILRNLAAAILCAVPLWGLLGCPMPTPELRFRQLEDRSLVPRSQIVYIWENPFPVRTTGSGEPRHIVIGRSGDHSGAMAGGGGAHPHSPVSAADRG